MIKVFPVNVTVSESAFESFASIYCLTFLFCFVFFVCFFLPDGLFQPYKLDDSIFHLRGVSSILFIYLFFLFLWILFYRKPCTQTV